MEKRYSSTEDIEYTCLYFCHMICLWPGVDMTEEITYTALIYNKKALSTLLPEVLVPIHITAHLLHLTLNKSKLEICSLIIHLFNFCAKFQNPNIQRGWKLFSVWAPQSTIAQIQVLWRTNESTKDYLSTRIATPENRYIGLRIQESLL